MNPFTEKTGKKLMFIGIVLFILGIILFLWQNISIDLSKQIDSSKLSQFGEFVGGLIGSLWAFAGVILFYVALTEQREDIKTNREALKTQVKALETQIEEFKLQRVELEQTRDVFIDQSKTLKLQQFESTFFNSMILLNNIIDNITFIVPPPQISYRLGEEPAFPQLDRTKFYKGRECFKLFYDKLKLYYNELIAKYVLDNFIETYSLADFNIPLPIKEDFANKAYVFLFENFQSDLGHYFRTIYNIVKFIKDNQHDNPKYYTNLLRSQLSTYEHLMLFYNCQSDYGIEKFKPLIIVFSMLDNMSSPKLLDPEHKLLFPDEAYL